MAYRCPTFCAAAVLALLACPALAQPDPAISEPPAEQPAPPPDSPASDPESPPAAAPTQTQKPKATRPGHRVTVKRRPSMPKPKPDDYTGPPTLLGRGKIAFGGYGGVHVRFSRVADTNALLVGGEGALLLDHKLAIGGAGYGLTTIVHGPDAADGSPRRLEFGYGGAVFRYHFLTRSLVYLSAGLLIGGGAFVLLDEEQLLRGEVDHHHADFNGFLVVEPQLGVHMNLTRWMRVGVDASYRFVDGVGLRGLSNADARGPSLGVGVEFGWL